MDFEVNVDDARSYMRATITGHPTLDQLLALAHVLGVESADWPHPALLLDLRGVATEFNRAEQAQVGEAAASSLAHLPRIASLVPPQRLTRVSQRAAQRSGANVHVFDDEAQALAWLAGRAQSGE